MVGAEAAGAESQVRAPPLFQQQEQQRRCRLPVFLRLQGKENKGVRWHCCKGVSIMRAVTSILFRSLGESWLAQEVFHSRGDILCYNGCGGFLQLVPNNKVLDWEQKLGHESIKC